MPKSKPKATLMVASGNGGMVQVRDRRFEPVRDWPIRVEVSQQQAETWLRYFSAETERRGWSSSRLSQIEASENSGTINVNSGSTDKPELAVVWERRRGGRLAVRARYVGGAAATYEDVQALFDQVGERCLSGVLERVYMRRTLEYYGLPWCGEYWLDDTLRLGPPSRQYDKAPSGPRAIVVDALVGAVGRGMRHGCSTKSCASWRPF